MQPAIHSTVENNYKLKGPAQVQQVWGYEITNIPEYDSELPQTGAALLDDQVNFLHTACNWLKTFANFSLELRFCNDAVRRQNRVYLLVFLGNRERQYNTGMLLNANREAMEQLFPRGFTFSRVSEAELQSLISPDREATVLSIRRKPAVVPVHKYNMQFNVRPVLAPMTTGVGGPALKPQQTSSMCLPALPYIDARPGNWQHTFRLMVQQTNEVQVRIAITPDELTTMEKMLGLHYFQLLYDPSLHRPLTRTDPEQSLLDGLEKYKYAAWLYGMNIQVASVNRVAAQLVAQSVLHQCTNPAHPESLEIIVADGRGGPSPRQCWEGGILYYDDFPAAVCNRVREYNAFLDKSLYLFAESEAAQLFRFPMADEIGIPGFMAMAANPFQAPLLPARPDRSIIFGNFITDNSTLNKTHPALTYYIDSGGLARHGLIVGMPGFGKTNITLLMLRQLMAFGIPFLLIEPVKSEYHAELCRGVAGAKDKVHYYQMKNPFRKDGSINPGFLRFNPLIPAKGISISEHISFIKSALMAAAPMEGVMPVIFEDFLNQFYHRLCGSEENFYDDSFELSYRPGDATGLQPSVSSFIAFSEEFFSDPKRFGKAKSNDEIIAILKRRIIRFTEGMLGQVFKPDHLGAAQAHLMEDNVKAFLHKPCIIDLESIGDDEDKALLMAFVLTYLYEDRKLRQSHDPNNQLHITFVEEAHRLLANNAPAVGQHQQSAGGSAKVFNLFNNLLAEARAKAQGIIIVEQSPSKLAADAIKNTNLKIMHRLASRQDQEYLGAAMQMNAVQMAYAGRLKNGEAIVFDDRLDRPALVKMNKF